MIKRLYLILLFVSLSFFSSRAQSVIIGNNSFSGIFANYGPFSTNSATDTAYTRFAYIYPKASIDSLKHGDSIRAFSFFRTGTERLRYGPNMRIFVRMSIFSDFGTGPLNWTSESQSKGMVKVFDGDPSTYVGSRGGWCRFPFDSAFVVDTTLGKENLEILIEYVQKRRESWIEWSYENNLTVPTFVSNNETKYTRGAGFPQDTVRTSNVRKPALKIHIPRFKKNLRVNKIYSLGRAPILMNTPDTIKAWVENEGLETVYNYPVYLNITGANKARDTFYLDSLQPYQSKMVYFGNHDQMNRSGVENVQVYVNADKYPQSDSLSIRRDVNYNVYSHVNPYQQMGPTGIGFNGQTGDFAAKFYLDSVQYMNQIKVDFSGSGVRYQLGVWQTDANGKPGKELYMSDTLTTQNGTNILTVSPKLKIDSSFYVGIRQPTNTNVGFSYQNEVPLRRNTFYYTVPAGGSLWQEFDEYNEAFTFNIQPRIQVANDVGVLAVRKPIVTDTVEYSKDSVAPIVTFVNYGYANQNAPFDVVCEVRNEYNQVIYKSTRAIKLKAEDTLQVTFDKTLNFIYLRNNTMTVYTDLPDDKVRDNDTIVETYFVGILHDVYCEAFFSPFENEEFRLNTDYVKPVARVVNIGIRAKKNVSLTIRALKDGVPIYAATKFADLNSAESLIVPFDSFVLTEEGKIEIQVYCHNIIDSFPINDTARVFVNVIKSDDIGLLSIIKPKDKEVFHRKDRFKPFVNVRNFGTDDQDSVGIECTITNSSQTIVYRDTATKKYTRISTTQEIFDEFTVPDINDVYTITFIVLNKEDQDRSNDTLVYTFFGKSKIDLAAIEVVNPVNNQKVPTGTPDLIPEVKIQNIGTQTIAENQWVWIEIKANGFNYRDSAQIPFAIPSDSAFVFKFNKGISTNLLNAYEMYSWVNTPSDQTSSNDTIYSRFSIEADFSIVLKEVQEPIDSTHFEQNIDIYTPTVLIKNNGLQDISSTSTVRFRVDYNKAIIANESINIDALEKGKDSLVKFTPIPVGKKGEYSFTASVNNAQDQVDHDDTIKGKYFVGKANDIAAYQLLLPHKDSVLYANDPYEVKGSFINLGDSDQNLLFSVTMQIFDDGAMIYNSNYSLQMKSGDTTAVDFPSDFTPDRKAFYDYLLFSRLGADQERENDTIKGIIESTWSLGVEVLRSEGPVLMPNPSAGKVELEIPGVLLGSQYQIKNALGAILGDGLLNEEVNSLNFTDLSAGIYFIEIRKDDKVTTLRFAIQK